MFFTLSRMRDFFTLRNSPLNPVKFVAFSLFVATLAACSPPEERSMKQVYSRSEIMVPMRDGIKLYTEVFTPDDAQGPLPIILVRTPYDASSSDDDYGRVFNNIFRELAKGRYIFAVQDARGRFKSEGKFEWNRPVRHMTDPDAIDASTDAYDSIDWLINNMENNNGRVGMLGVSYLGWYTTMALIDPHPALKAASPQASPSDYFVNDDFFHHGAFRLSPSAELPYLFDFDPKENSRFPYDQVDTYEFFLDMGPLSTMNDKYLHGVSPTWNNYMAHSTYDEYWQTGGTLQHLTEVTVPTLNVVGWWDAENLGGALDIYDQLEPRDSQGLNRIVVGPWSHGQWFTEEATALGNYQFGSNTSSYYQKEIEAPWFAFHLKGEGETNLSEATMFQTGSNQWKNYDAWPPESGVTQKNLYLHADGRLSFDPPAEGDAGAHESYVSDPAKPVPYSKRPIMGFWSPLKDSKVDRFQRAGKLWKTEDQRFVHDRQDVLSWITEPLEEDMEVSGAIAAQLFASTTGTDSDWVVKLIDVYPEKYQAEIEMGGYQLMIADDVLRGKFRNSFETPEPITPNKVTGYTVNLRTRNHMFRQGHRIMVQVQSSWFPLIDRNPQKFVDIPSATAEDYLKAEQKIYFSPASPSHISLPVVERE